MFAHMQRRLFPVSDNLNRNSVERTLLIPLWCRALAAKKLPEMLPDYDAGRILKEMGETKPPHPLYYMQCASVTGAVRQYNLAEEIRNYLAEKPEAAVVELGAGLSCLRRQLNWTGSPWLSLDLPDVIRLREQFIPTAENEQNIACDITDRSWFDLIPFNSAKGIIFMAAGLFHYFDSDTVRCLICDMAKRFPGGALVFDITTGKGFRNGNFTVHTSGNDTNLKFFIDDAASELSGWSPLLKNISQRDYYTGYGAPDRNYSLFTKLYIRSKRGQLIFVHTDFASPA